MPRPGLLPADPARPALHLPAGVGALTLGRLHEVCGPDRATLALMVAGALSGPVFWIAPAWASGRLNTDGMAPFADPGRFLFAEPRRADDLLWTLEEVLRSGTVPLAVAELPQLPGLTPVRRLHLAAEAGAARAAAAGSRGPVPLGLILTPGLGGAPGVESRWHMAGAHRPAPKHPAAAGTGAQPPGIPGALRPGWRLTRRRARTAPPAAWVLSGGPGRWRAVAHPDTD